MARGQGSAGRQGARSQISRRTILSTPRIFLSAPEGITPALALDCIKAACAAGDVASLLIPASLAREVTAEAQALGVAVMVSGEARDAARAGADGIQVDAGAVADARSSIGKDRFIGAFAGASRHAAMEAAEAGADYIAFDQNGASVGGEPIIRWWADMMEIPCVAFTPVEADKLDTLLPQKPDFIRPSDAMWSDAASATRIVSELTARLSKQ